MKTNRPTTFLWLAGLGLLLAAQTLSADNLKPSKHCVTCVEVPIVVTETTILHTTVTTPVVFAPTSQLASTLPLVIPAPKTTASNQTFLVVNCPHEAEVRIDDFLTKSTGPSRLFRLSSDQSHLPRKVVISMTKYNKRYREEYEHTEFAHCQPGKTTTLSIKKEEMNRKKICEPDCTNTMDATGTAVPSTAQSISLDDRAFAELFAKSSEADRKALIEWDQKRRLLAADLEAKNKTQAEMDAAEASLKNLKSRLNQMEDAYLAKLDEAVAKWQIAASLNAKDDTGIRATMQSAIELERVAATLERQCSRLAKEVMASQPARIVASEPANPAVQVVEKTALPDKGRQQPQKAAADVASNRKSELDEFAAPKKDALTKAREAAMRKLENEQPAKGPEKLTPVETPKVGTSKTAPAK